MCVIWFKLFQGCLLFLIWCKTESFFPIVSLCYVRKKSSITFLSHIKPTMFSVSKIGFYASCFVIERNDFHNGDVKGILWNRLSFAFVPNEQFCSTKSCLRSRNISFRSLKLKIFLNGKKALYGIFSAKYFDLKLHLLKSVFWCLSLGNVCSNVYFWNVTLYNWYRTS